MLAGTTPTQQGIHTYIYKNMMNCTKDKKKRKTGTFLVLVFIHCKSNIHNNKEKSHGAYKRSKTKIKIKKKYNKKITCVRISLLICSYFNFRYTMVANDENDDVVEVVAFVTSVTIQV